MLGKRFGIVFAIQRYFQNITIIYLFNINWYDIEISKLEIWMQNSICLI